MLEEMRKARTFGIFVFRTDMVKNGDRYYGCAVIFVQNNMQAVIEIILGELDFPSLAKTESAYYQHKKANYN